VFEAAQEKDRLEKVHAQLQQLRDAVANAADLRSLLENPEVDTRVKGDVLARIAQGGDEEVVNFLRLIAEKGRARELTQIVDELDALVAEQERILDVEITTAIELSAESFQRLTQRIADASGREVQASRKVDPDLIGGIVLQAGSMRLDASVRGRLERLRHDLSTGGTHGAPGGPRLSRSEQRARMSLPPGEARLRLQTETSLQLTSRRSQI
jgi:F-type H+-transporting ATPase subunit delta